jgi:hypothetical protein
MASVTAFPCPFRTTYSNHVGSRITSISTWESTPDNNDPQVFCSFEVADDYSLKFPHSDMTAQDIVAACMDALLQNDIPRKNAGLEVCFYFSSDRCRAALGGSVEDFISYASNPTFGSMTNANEYIVLSVGPIIPATMTRGAMQTVLVRVTPLKGDHRTFLWYVCKFITALSTGATQCDRHAF